MPKLINLCDITLSKAFQVRKEINQDVVDEYVEALNAKAVFPPIDVFRIGRGYFMADGWHRYHATRKINRKAILCTVHEGDNSDCLKFCLKANNVHGLRRTNADKLRCVQLALREWPTLSDHQIADICNVSHTFVGKVKAKPVIHRPPPPPTPAREPELEAREPEPAAQEPENNGEYLDSMGFPIPEKVLPVWVRKSEVEEMVGYVEELIQCLKYAEASQDVLWHELAFQGVLTDLHNVLQRVKVALPYTVCTNCQGQLPETCRLCNGKGFISKFRFDNVVPEEMREMRKQGCK